MVRAINRSYRIAIFCGAFPLLVGVSIFVLWLITRWYWLAIVGVYTLFGGLAIFLVGICALAYYWKLVSEVTRLPSRRLWLSTLVCAGLLLLNFPVAGGIIASAYIIETRYTIVVHNASDEPVENFRIFGGGCDESLGSIPPGGTVRKSLWIQQDGELKNHALIGTTSHTKTTNAYVTHGMGGHTTITIKPDSSISVSNNP